MLRLLKPKRITLSQEELYELLRQGDPKAFNHFYNEVRPLAVMVLLKKGCPQVEAEDLFQDALTAMWQQVDDGRFQLKAGVKMSSYLIQLCSNRWIDRTRTVAFRNTVSADELPIEAEESGNVEGLESKEKDFLLMDVAFSQLGEKCQEMLRKFYFEKTSMKMLAEIRGITPQTAKNEKYRCVQRLKKIAQSLKSEDNDRTRV